MDRPLTYMDGETLMNTVLPPIRFVISQLLPQGLHVLAGAPKVGKSWLSLWLCLQVAKGEPDGNFPLPRVTYSTSVWRTATAASRAVCWISRTTLRQICSSLQCRRSCTVDWSSRSSASWRHTLTQCLSSSIRSSVSGAASTTPILMPVTTVTWVSLRSWRTSTGSPFY